jgi:hypothetical protein
MSIPFIGAGATERFKRHPVAESVDELADEILEPMGLEILEMELVDRPAWPRLQGSILDPWCCEELIAAGLLMLVGHVDLINLTIGCALGGSVGAERQPPTRTWRTRAYVLTDRGWLPSLNFLSRDSRIVILSASAAQISLDWSLGEQASRLSVICQPVLSAGG